MVATRKDTDDRNAGGTRPRPMAGRPLLAFDSRQAPCGGSTRPRFRSSPIRARAPCIPLIEKIAPSDANILVIGETGTGKELVARYVHSLSDRAKADFVAVNCGAFSESLIEGELFGYEKRRLYRRASRPAGWFEAANGGTLFLDEWATCRCRCR
jgi:sigma-54-specific transcriptional regulator